jgi:hypothetical protein
VSTRGRAAFWGGHDDRDVRLDEEPDQRRKLGVEDTCRHELDKRRNGRRGLGHLAEPSEAPESKSRPVGTGRLSLGTKLDQARPKACLTAGVNR